MKDLIRLTISVIFQEIFGPVESTKILIHYGTIFAEKIISKISGISNHDHQKISSRQSVRKVAQSKHHHRL